MSGNRVNINTADFGLLMKLPCVSKDIASDIVSRRSNGRFFLSFEDFVSTYSFKSYEVAHLRPLVCFDFIPDENVSYNVKNPKFDIPDFIDDSEILLKFNNASVDELARIPHISRNYAKNIVQLSESGYSIDSLEDLLGKLCLSVDDLVDINEYILNGDASSVEENIVNVDYEVNLDVKIDDSFTDFVSNPVDINSASVDVIKTLPGINLIQAKKLVNLRDEGIFISSCDDLKSKLNLKDSEIDVLRDKIVIKKTDSRNQFVRRIDL